MNILNPKFKYTNAASTNLRKTFARIRREQAEAKERDAAAVLERDLKVRKLK